MPTLVMRVLQRKATTLRLKTIVIFFARVESATTVTGDCLLASIVSRQVLQVHFDYEQVMMGQSRMTW